MMLIQHSVNSDWLFNTQSRVLQSKWLILEHNAKATVNRNMPYFCYLRWFSLYGVACPGYELGIANYIDEMISRSLHEYESWSCVYIIKMGTTLLHFVFFQ